jgi:acyl-[acyl-carrier-protein]-phospholipid O-acyltransferase / long-chain-fatty-acid--[acyl-carrier-protein] ligase
MHDGLIRLVLWVVSRGFFKPTLVGVENVPTRGPALLASNHVTYMDGFLIWFFVPCAVRYIVWKPFFRIPGIGWALRYIEAIPVADSGPRSMRETIRLAKQQLVEGNVVCIFPEGSITRDGEMHSFRRGMESIVKGLDVPIIPVHLGGLWGNIFSFEGGRAFLKWPKRWRNPATISFGKPMPTHSSPDEVRQAVEQLGAELYGRSDFAQSGKNS